MLAKIEFSNFRVLQNTTLELQPLTVLVGPNGSGKSTAIQGIRSLAVPGILRRNRISSFGRPGERAILSVSATIGGQEVQFSRQFSSSRESNEKFNTSDQPIRDRFWDFIRSVRCYDLSPSKIEQPSEIDTNVELLDDCTNLPSFIDQIRDNNEEVFASVVEQLHRWHPEFDDIRLTVPSKGRKAIRLRHTATRELVESSELSDGVLLTLAILAIANQPARPSMICFEEPEFGLHPRLMEPLVELLLSLAYPNEFGRGEDPVQVLLTTHSPYLLDQFKDRPECVVVAEKHPGGSATFHSLKDRPDMTDLLEGPSLGETWYSGVLGGVPAGV